MRLGWRTIREIPIPDIGEWIADATKNGQEVHIGCDSLQTSTRTQFCTVLVAYQPGKGGRAAYCREVVPRIKSLRERLLKEVWSSVEVAMQLTPMIKGELSVHVDASPEEKNLSSKYIQELCGLVVAQGFRAVIKPDSWCASTVGDHIVRRMGKKSA